MSKEDIYMRRCFQLALLGSGDVAPNPMVGAVLVHEDTIIGEGYHQRYGEVHAEVNCIRSVNPVNEHLIKESTLYVSLEPCSHFGKTPPCTGLIIQQGIKKVVIGCEDFYEKVKGSGIAKLKASAISVTSGVLEAEALHLNRRFFTFHREKRPYIILKWAQSTDRKIAEHNKRMYISNKYTNMLVHKWRAEEAAIMVGTNTALLDNPSLTTRLWHGRNPLRIIIDKYLKVPADAVLMKDEHPAIIINTLKHEELGNKLFYRTADDENMLAMILNLLHQRNIISMIIEGGAGLLKSFIDAGLWDEARIITNSNIHIEAGMSAPSLSNGVLIETMNIGSDQVDFFENTNH